MTYIPDGAITSTLNTTTVNLVSEATYTGTWELNDARDVMVSCKSDIAGTLYFDFSNDGILADSFPVAGFTVAANIHEFHVAVKGPRYFRARFINGVGAQSSFRLYTYYGDFRQGNLPLNAGISSDNDAIIVRSVGVGENAAGSYENVKIDGLGFSTTALLANNETYDSGILDIRGYTQVQTDVLSVGASGTIGIEFHENASGNNVLRALNIPYNDGDGYSFFSAPAFTPYVRYQFTANEDGQTQFYYDTKFTTKALSGQILGLDDFISPAMVGNLGRNIIVGQTDGGNFKNVPLTTEGHLEMAIHEPLLPFGSLHTESMTPIFQTDAVYGINDSEAITTMGLAFDPGPSPGTSTGTVTTANEMFTCATGNTAYSFASLQSRKRLRYRAGQGVINRFTALWSTPAASSIVVAGCGSGESGYFFGYNGTSFGILHSTDGVREIQTFTVSAATGGAGTATFRLNGLDTTVNLTIQATTILTANEIASQTFPGWSVEARGATVIFVANSVGNKTGTFSFTLGTATDTAGTFAETKTGVAATDMWYPQTEWNGDVCDGTGLSGFNLDTTKGNLFQIDIAWLGFGATVFKIMVPSIGGNNATWIKVHTINHPNARTTPHVNQPSFPFTASAYSAGSTTDVSVSIGSFAGFIEGDIQLTGPRSSYSDISQAVTTGDYYTLFSIRNDLIYGAGGSTERANQSVINILSFGGAHDDATPIIFYLLKNAALVGPTEWTKWANNSCAYFDTGATTATISDNLQIIEVIPVGQAGSIQVTLEDTVTLEPGETLTVAATAVTGTSTWTIATLNTREDQ